MKLVIALCLTAATGIPVDIPVESVTTHATFGMSAEHPAPEDSAVPLYFYITFHGGGRGAGVSPVNQVIRYCLNGTSYGTVLETPPDGTTLQELRSTSLYQEHLFVANANTDDSFIAVYGACGAGGKRPFIRKLVSSEQDPLLDHPYGISKVLDGFIYVTSQDTDSLTRYSVANLLGDKPASEGAVTRNQTSFPSPSFGSVRGLAVDSQARVIYVADEKGDKVQAIGPNSAVPLFTIDIPSPVGVHFDAMTRKLYVGSNNGFHSAVLEYAVDSKQVTKKFVHDSITHPAGIVSTAKKLYVLAQTSFDQLHSFDLETGKHQIVISELPDAPEHITISPC